MVKKKKKVAAKAVKPKHKAKKVATPKARKTAKRPAVKKSARSRGASKAGAKAPQGPEANMEKIGVVTHYFPHVNAAAVMLKKDGLKVGDDIYLKGHTTDFMEKVQSIQLDHVPIQEGRKGQEIGLMVKERVRTGDSVYKA